MQRDGTYSWSHRQRVQKAPENVWGEQCCIIQQKMHSLGPRAYPSEGKNPSAYFNMSWTYPLAASILGCESVYGYFTICHACWQVPSLNTQDLLIGNSFNVAVKASDHQAVKRPKASTTWVKGMRNRSTSGSLWSWNLFDIWDYMGKGNRVCPYQNCTCRFVNPKTHNPPPLALFNPFQSQSWWILTKEKSKTETLKY